MYKGIVIVIGCLIAFGVGVGVGAVWIRKPEAVKQVSSKYELLNPNMENETEIVISKQEYVVLRQQLIDYIVTQSQVGKLRSAAVYFRDLHNGPTFGIEERSDFAPASLLKLPLLITYLGMAEDDPPILEKKLVFKQKVATTEIEGQFYTPKEIVEEDKPYSIDELLYRMAALSDNNAYDVLFTYLTQLPEGQDQLLTTFRELGIIFPQSTLEDTISVKGYASIFRLLYNGSYLSPEMSEKALEMLLESEFEQGLELGVPTGVKIAHKFGERSLKVENDNSVVRQLHDCGIVYFPDNPYVLCIMTRGEDFDKLSQVLGSISKMVWDEVDARRIRR